MAPEVLASIYQAIPALLSLPERQSWIDYDLEADVLYIRFQKPMPATDSRLVNDDVLLRERKGKVIGITIMHASQMGKDGKRKKAAKR